MKVSIVSGDLVKKGESYMDQKNWSFAKAFEKIGIKAESFSYKKKGKLKFIEKSKYIKTQWRAYMNKQLIQHVIRVKPDVLMVLKGETIRAETLWEIRKKTDTLIINVFPDNPIYMGRFEAIEPCHYYFVKDTYVLSTLRKAGLKNVYYLPQCTDIDVHKPMELTSQDETLYKSDLSLIGSMYPYRAKFIEQLIEFKPYIWGKGWSKSSNSEILRLYCGMEVKGTQKAKAICATTISINPHHPLNDIFGVNRRTYDIAACKGFQIADYKNDMNTVFKVDKEIICFKTIEEFKDLVKYYLKNPAELADIAEAAYKRVIKDHTYDNRVKEILEIIK